MAYRTLYRKYRPKTFDEVVGQEHIVKTIQNAIKTNKIAHAYLFCGPRGTGKTTMAKLLAKACNCESMDDNKPCNECLNCRQMNEGIHPDIIELDAASNNGVEQIREIIEKVKYTPITGKYKVYIIDEVHMLSTSAFNALLKTLEEPPAYVIFILATTDPQKVLPTIISRCQRYNFLKVSKKDIAKKLAYVLDQEHVKYEENALELIGELADGGLRDALSILEQALAYNREVVTTDMIASIFGVASVLDKIDFIKLVNKRNYKEIQERFDQLMIQGVNLDKLIKDLMVINKELIVYDMTKDSSMLNVCSEEQMISLHNEVSIEFAKRMLEVLMDVSNNSYKSDARIYFEIGLLKLMEVKNVSTPKNETETVTVKEKPVVQEKKITKEDPLVKLIEENRPSEVKEEPKIEENTEEVVEDDEILCYDNDYLLGLMIQGSKEEKERTIEVFNKLNDLKNDIRVFRYAKILLDTTVFSTGDDFIILNAKYSALCNQINETTMNKMLYQFICEELHMDKMIYAISDECQAKLVNDFIVRRQNRTLPAKSVVNKYDIEINNNEEKDEIIEKLNKLVGSNNFNVEE